MSTEQFGKPQGRSLPNGVGGDGVQAKLTALLDDATVQGTANGPTTPDETSHKDEGAESDFADNESPVNAELARITAQIKSIQAGAGKSQPTESSAAPASTPAPPTVGAVTVKGRGDGVAIELGKGLWPELIQELNDRLAQSGNFFRGGHVALDVGGRPLLEGELGQVRTALESHGMTLGVVRTSAERTFESAIALGLAARLTTDDGQVGAEVESAASNQGFANFFVYRGNLRSGQVLERNEHIVVIGDVNPGAEIVSQGDILVWGRIRGIAHAGAAGDKRSVVVALHLEPVQLRIAGVVAIDVAQTAGATGRRPTKSGDKRPEVAHIAGDQIVIEPWDESKPGGLAIFRR